MGTDICRRHTLRIHSVRTYNSRVESLWLPACLPGKGFIGIICRHIRLSRGQGREGEELLRQHEVNILLLLTQALSVKVV